MTGANLGLYVMYVASTSLGVVWGYQWGTKGTGDDLPVPSFRLITSMTMLFLFGEIVYAPTFVPLSSSLSPLGYSFFALILGGLLSFSTAILTVLLFAVVLNPLAKWHVGKIKNDKE